MFFILYLLSILTILVGSHLRTDCYASFSYPIINIRVSHYNPSGPFYLFTTFQYTRFSNITGKSQLIYEVDYHFRKVDNCTPSVLFTTLGDDFEKLYVKIILHLYEFQKHIAFITYIFYKGFKPGVYVMFDGYKNFAVHVQILDVSKDHLRVRSQPINFINSYITSISGKFLEICVITQNNRVVSLTPLYESSPYKHYITVFRSEIYRDGKLIGIRDYPAFKCNKGNIYNDESVILITDGENFDIYLYVVDIDNKTIRFQLLNRKFDYVYNLQKIPREYKQIFLIKYKTEATQCSDGSRIISYLSENNITYYAEVTKTFILSPNIKYIGLLYHSPFTLCRKRKNME